MTFDPSALARDVPLAPRTTLELGGTAERFYEATSEAELEAALAYAHEAGLPVTILAGGSNVVIDDAGVRGLVIAPRLRGLTAEVRGDRLELTAAAGEPWDDVVARAVAEGARGIECLSGIPGWAGATPIQNVGAYGQEVADTLVAVRAIDRRTGARVVIPAQDCGFAYRDSRFKRAPDAYVVTSITLSLVMGAPERPRYAELERALPERADLEAIRRAVLALRRAKSMVWDPSDPNRRSAGSFFTNPVVPDDVADHVVAIALRDGLVTEARAVPRHAAAPGTSKLSAGWLIERSGFAKGLRDGAVGLSTAHALALVHHGGGTTRSLLALAERVREGVHARFGVTLEREPVLLGG